MWAQFGLVRMLGMETYRFHGHIVFHHRREMELWENMALLRASFRCKTCWPWRWRQHVPPKCRYRQTNYMMSQLRRLQYECSPSRKPQSLHNVHCMFSEVTFSFQSIIVGFLHDLQTLMARVFNVAAVQSWVEKHSVPVPLAGTAMKKMLHSSWMTAKEGALCQEIRAWMGLQSPCITCWGRCSTFAVSSSGSGRPSSHSCRSLTAGQ